MNKNKLAAILGLVLAIPTIFEGSSVLLGINTPNQIVLIWLVAYNVLAALFSLYVVAAIWLQKPGGKKLALLMLIMHGSVLFILAGIFFTTGHVAIKSIMAMTMRSVVWIIINSLIKRSKP